MPDFKIHNYKKRKENHIATTYDSLEKRKLEKGILVSICNSVTEEH